MSTWNGPRLAAAISALKDGGMSESQVARLARVGRATVNRWGRGANRPDHDAIRRLADRVHPRYPGIARELVEASGYPWTEPEPVPRPELRDNPELLARLEDVYSDDPEKLQAIVERLSPRPPEGNGGAQARQAG